MSGQQKAQPLSHPDKTLALTEQVTVRAPDSVWTFGENKLLFLLPRFEPRSLQPLAQSLYRLLYIICKYSRIKRMKNNAKIHFSPMIPAIRNSFVPFEYYLTSLFCHSLKYSFEMKMDIDFW